jgi:hypothetical protein
MIEGWRILIVKRVIYLGDIERQTCFSDGNSGNAALLRTFVRKWIFLLTLSNSLMTSRLPTPG